MRPAPSLSCEQVTASSVCKSLPRAQFRPSPVPHIRLSHFRLAQSAERMTLNHAAGGSSPPSSFSFCCSFLPIELLFLLCWVALPTELVTELLFLPVASSVPSVSNCLFSRSRAGDPNAGFANPGLCPAARACIASSHSHAFFCFPCSEAQAALDLTPTRQGP